MSNYCGNIANKYGIKVGIVQKLVPNLGNKSKYGEIVSVKKSSVPFITWNKID